MMISGLQHVLIFFEMSFDFHESFNAYHLGDTVAIESGYQKHVPVWQAMNQHKYVERRFLTSNKEIHVTNDI